MSTENITNDVSTDDNLDSFAAEFFGENPQPSDNAKSEEAEIAPEVEDDAPEQEDTHSADDGATDETEDEQSEDSEETDSDNEQKPKGKNRYQERINELTAKARQAERERDELLRKLNEKPTDPKPEPKAQENTVTASEGPAPTDKNEDGTDKYPLGEFDPRFVKDTIQHALNEQARQQEAKKAEIEKLSAEQQYRATLENTWKEKLEVVQERYPDYQEKGEQMLSVFEGIDPAYGQYLTDTLMEMDAGPEVFYYLANNLDEADQIVNAGPRKATIALAKLEAQLVGSPTAKTPVKKTTNAPPPPPQMKGSAVSKASIPLDTDDLDAFSKVLFKKK